MHAKTHCCVGISAALLLTKPSIDILVMSFLFTILGSIVPDIDNEYAAARIIPSMAVIYILATILGIITLDKFSITGILLFLLMLIISYFTVHRTLTHSLSGMVLFAIPLAFIDWPLVPPFIIGYMLHLIADSFTKTGTNYLYPIKKTKYGPMFINTHETGDLIFFFPGLAAMILIFLLTYDIKQITLSLWESIF